MLESRSKAQKTWSRA